MARDLSKEINAFKEVRKYVETKLKNLFKFTEELGKEPGRFFRNAEHTTDNTEDMKSFVTSAKSITKLSHHYSGQILEILSEQDCDTVHTHLKHDLLHVLSRLYDYHTGIVEEGKTHQGYLLMKSKREQLGKLLKEFNNAYHKMSLDAPMPCKLKFTPVRVRSILRRGVKWASPFTVCIFDFNTEVTVGRDGDQVSSNIYDYGPFFRQVSGEHLSISVDEKGTITCKNVGKNKLRIGNKVFVAGHEEQIELIGNQVIFAEIPADKESKEIFPQEMGKVGLRYKVTGA